MRIFPPPFEAPAAEPDAGDGVPRDRLSEHAVPLHPIATFAERICAAVDAVPADREPYVLHDGLRGAVVLGWSGGGDTRRFEDHQVESFSRMFMWKVCRVPPAFRGEPEVAYLLTPLIAAMPDAELLVARLVAFNIDPPDADDPGSCTLALDAALRARRS